MHRLQLLVVDLVLISIATVLALLLRDNFELSVVRLFALLPYLAVTLAAALVIFPLLRISRTIWRFTAMSDYLQLLAATALTVIAAVALGFVYNRLDGIARALPVLQAILMLVALVGARIYMRLRHAARVKPMQLNPLQGHERPADTVLVVGASRLTDLYLRTIAELAPQRIRIAGLLARNPHQAGRVLHGERILGTPDQVAEVLRDLEVHGVFVDRIVVTTTFDKLADVERAALLEVERSTSVRLEFIAERMGLEVRSDNHGDYDAAQTKLRDDSVAFVITDADIAALALRPYWRIKRTLDAVGSLVLLMVLTPVILVAGVLAAIDVGLPVTFWQQRPGLGGRPFRLYKLRTMAAAHGIDGRHVPDSQRTSPIGRFLRRTRLDELPQLLNILTGEMSFIGPRPLLPSDQSPAYAARLLVRPGLTGWAQVKGGRDISAANKAALDIWYVKNASLRLDLAVIMRTAQMLVVGERVNKAAIREAWRDLHLAGISSPDEWATGERLGVNGRL